jgi:hypothetical protein
VALLLIKEMDNKTKSEEFTKDTQKIQQSTTNLVASKAQHHATGTSKIVAGSHKRC